MPCRISSARAGAADGDGLIVCFDYDRKRRCEIPEAIVSAIEALED